MVHRFAAPACRFNGDCKLFAHMRLPGKFV
jgi:hypothetical protein